MADGVFIEGPGQRLFASSLTLWSEIGINSIAHHVARYLEHQGLLVCDVDSSYLTSDAPEEGPMDQLLGYSITYRVAVAPQQGRKAFTLQNRIGQTVLFA